MLYKPKMDKICAVLSAFVKKILSFSLHFRFPRYKNNESGYLIFLKKMSQENYNRYILNIIYIKYYLY
jgi:hypothetical protein